jgi:heterodisulfide reductase subunit A2
MSKTVIVIGGGIAGMQAASSLSARGVEVILLEKGDQLGGHVGKWDRLFPTRRKSEEVVDFLKKGLNDGISILLNANLKEIRKNDREFTVILDNGENLSGEALLFTTGFDLFDARKKEEYGYGIYDNVITSADLEEFFHKNRQPDLLKGITIKRIGIIHCVGSRDEKVGNLYCSKVCCITGVKQAIEIKEMVPASEVFCFYMDLRMFDRHFEEMYLEAQQKWGIQFIRGRLSEASENPDHSILLKVEDTLAGLPLKMTVDLVILLTGFVPSAETKRLAAMVGLQPAEDGFLIPVDEQLLPNTSSVQGVFLAGSVKGPASIQNTIADAKAAAIQIIEYLERFA